VFDAAGVDDKAKGVPFAGSVRRVGGGSFQSVDGSGLVLPAEAGLGALLFIKEREPQLIVEEELATPFLDCDRFLSDAVFDAAAAAGFNAPLEREFEAVVGFFRDQVLENPGITDGREGAVGERPAFAGQGAEVFEAAQRLPAAMSWAEARSGRMRRMKTWRDISIPSFDGMVNWPGDGRVEMKRVMSIADGAVCNVTRLNMSVHTGTHMDAPGHFIADGVTMEAWPAEATMGRCRVIEILDPTAVTAAELAPYDVQAGERILFKTENSRQGRLGEPAFFEPFVYVAEDAAQLMVARGVRSVGVDYLSVGGFFKDGVETHVALLGAGVWVIEGLDLSAVEPGEYELSCMPLKLLGADGAPCRAMLR